MKTKNNNQKTFETMQRPVYYGQKGKDLTRYYRVDAAYNLAARVCKVVTIDEYKKAERLLNACTRYALAKAHQWGKANTSEFYCNSKQAEKDENRIDKRREKLQQELKKYGLIMINYGLYPTIEELDENGKTSHAQRCGTSVNLYYFN